MIRGRREGEIRHKRKRKARSKSTKTQEEIMKIKETKKAR